MLDARSLNVVEFTLGGSVTELMTIILPLEMT